MTDAAEPDAESATDDREPTLATRLLDLQRIDTQSDQLRVQRERLPERSDLATRSEQMTAWERRRSTIETRLADLTAIIEQAEARNVDLTADRTRLEGQLKTVIAPREAEALMHEIEMIKAQIDEADEVELAIPVSVRARFPVSSALRKSRFHSAPETPSSRARSHAPRS